MNSFKEKIMQKRRDEQAMLRASFQNFETAILSDHSSENINNEFVATQKAVETVLKYYGKKVKKIPKYIDGIDARLEYAMRPYGIMRRSIALTEKWYKDSFGPIIAFTKKENRPVALIPNNWGGYTYHDYVSGAEVHLNKFTATFFKKEGLCFYRPLPQKNVGKLSLLMYMRKCIPASDYIKATLSILVVTLLGLLLPRITYVISGKVVEDRDTTLLYVISALLLSVLATSQMINIVKEQIVNRIKIKAVVQVEAALMARLVLLPVNFFRQYSAGDLYSRTCYATFLCESVIENTFSVGISFLMSLLFLEQIRRYTPELYPMSLIIVLVVIGLSVVAAVKQNEISHKRMKRESEEMGINYSMIAGVQKIKTTGAEKRAFSKWADTYSETAKETYNPPFFLKIFPVLPIVVLLFGTVFIYFFAYASDVIYASDYIAFSTAFAMLMVAVNAVSSSALSVAEAMPILEMVKPILAEIPETSENKELIVGVKGNIDINQLSFSYPLSSTRVIEDFSLHIKEGEYVAIVGKSGSGKSTLLRLLLGFEKPEKGNILYDGKDLNKIDLKSLRRSIGTVLQNDSIVFGDIYTNITFHSPWLTVDDAWKAAEIAGIAEDIRQMPMGMRTIIDEGQGGLSGGQKQRILIARAIVLHPRILFFDEATSALDNITQKQVADALDTLDCTRVIIAHRLSTVQNCDRILVLDHGKIIEQGSYEELMKMDGTFAELVRRQRIDAEV